MSTKKQTSAKGIFKTSVLTVAMIVTVTIGAIYLYVNQAGGLRRLLETELSLMVGVDTATVGQARFSLIFSSQPIQVTAKNIVISLKSEKINLPSTDIRFGLTSIFNGQPEMIILRGIKLDLVKKTAGWAGSPALLFLGQITKGLNQANSPSNELRIGHNRLQGIKNIVIETDRLSLSHEVGTIPKLAFEDIYIDVRLGDNGKVFGHLRANCLNQDEHDAGSFAVSFEGLPGSHQIKLDLSASKLATRFISGYTDLLPVYLRQIGVLSGRVGLEVNDGSLANLNADVKLTDGVLVVPGASQNIDFDTAKLVFAYRGSSDSLTVSQAELNMGGKRRLSFDGVVRQLLEPVSVIKGVVEASNLPIQSVFERWPNSVAPDLKNKIRKMFSGGYFKSVKATFEGAFVSENNKWDLLKIDLDSQFSGVRANVASGQYKRIVSTVHGKLGLTGVTGSSVEEVVVDLTMEDGSMLIAGFDQPVNLSSGQLKSVFRDKKATMERLALDMGGVGRLALDGTLKMGSDWELHDLNVNLNVPDMDVALFSALWPQWASSETRDWVAENIPVGRIIDANLLLSADLSAPKGVRKVYDVKGDMKLRNAHLKWAKDATSLTNVDADIQWNNDRFFASILGGRVEDLILQKASVSVAPVLEKVKKNAVVSVIAQGGVSTVFKLAREVGLKAYGIFDFEEVGVDGDIKFTTKANVPLHQERNFIEQIQNFEASLSNGSFNNLPNNMSIENAELEMNMTKLKSEIVGTAFVDGVSNDFSLTIENKTGQTNITSHIPPSTLLVEKIANLSGLDLSGAVGGKFDYSGDLSGLNALLDVTIDLQGLKAVIPELGWSKSSRESGWLSLTASMKRGKLDALKNIALVAGNLSAHGELVFDKNGQFAAAFFERAAWPKNDVRDLIIRQNDTLKWAVEGNAKLLNLDTVFNENQTKFVGEIDYNFSGDQISVSDRITLSGRLAGNRASNGIGFASFQGTMFIDDNTWLDETNMKIHSSPDGNKVTATGLIGGGEVNLIFDAMNGSKPELLIETMNGGRILSALDVTNTIRGGRLTLKNVFQDSTLSSYDTKIRLKNFQVVEAPTALRALSVLSLVGLYSLVDGDGTSFRQGEADLEVRGPKVNIKILKASGDALGIAITGTYNRSNKKVNVSGNLVPANLISKALGSLPLLGDLITGVDNSGVFVTQFNITGTSDNMETSVIPVSTVAPGLIRDIFSPNWLNNEQKRILSPDEKQ
ncbi:DUF3971 domain-containing protein [Candidatus Puniceispirillum sp.]|nr:DUF3971 domain-containing protein [Candidatus Puniceispirillum sp.]